MRDCRQLRPFLVRDLCGNASSTEAVRSKAHTHHARRCSPRSCFIAQKSARPHTAENTRCGFTDMSVPKQNVQYYISDCTTRDLPTTVNVLRRSQDRASSSNSAAVRGARPLSSSPMAGQRAGATRAPDPLIIALVQLYADRLVSLYTVDCTHTPHMLPNSKDSTAYMSRTYKVHSAISSDPEMEARSTQGSAILDGSLC